MRILAVSAATMVLLASGMVAPSAQAAGCIKGAVVGGVVGHYAGHHGLLGAGAGCLIGRHEANKRTRETDRHEYDRRAGYGY